MYFSESYYTANGSHHDLFQGYVVYSVKQKLKQEYVGLPGNEIKNLKLSGVEVCLNSCIYRHLRHILVSS